MSGKSRYIKVLLLSIFIYHLSFADDCQLIRSLGNGKGTLCCTVGAVRSDLVQGGIIAHACKPESEFNSSETCKIEGKGENELFKVRLCDLAQLDALHKGVLPAAQGSSSPVLLINEIKKATEFISQVSSDLDSSCSSTVVKEITLEDEKLPKKEEFSEDLAEEVQKYITTQLTKFDVVHNHENIQAISELLKLIYKQFPDLKSDTQINQNMLKYLRAAVMSRLKKDNFVENKELWDEIEFQFPQVVASSRGISLNEEYWNEHLGASIGRGRLVYLKTQEEREEFEITLDQKGSIRKQGELYTTTKTSNYSAGIGFIKSPIFIIAPDFKIYSTHQNVKRFHHSSFLAGAPILCGGEIVIRNGRIAKISNESGHYHPSEFQLLACLKFLKEKGVDLSKTLLVLYPDRKRTMAIPFVTDRSERFLEILKDSIVNKDIEHVKQIVTENPGVISGKFYPREFPLGIGALEYLLKVSYPQGENIKVLLQNYPEILTPALYDLVQRTNDGKNTLQIMEKFLDATQGAGGSFFRITNSSTGFSPVEVLIHNLWRDLDHLKQGQGHDLQKVQSMLNLKILLQKADLGLFETELHLAEIYSAGVGQKQKAVFEHLHKTYGKSNLSGEEEFRKQRKISSAFQAYINRERGGMHPDVIEAFIRAGQPPEIRTLDGRTLLHIAAVNYSSVELFKRLLEDFDKVELDGKMGVSNINVLGGTPPCTPLDFALLYRFPDGLAVRGFQEIEGRKIIAELLRRGAKTSCSFGENLLKKYRKRF